MTTHVEETTVAQDDVDEPTVEETVDKDAPETESSGSGGRWRIALLLVAALFAASGSVMWWVSDQDPDRATAQTRDDVLIQARQAISTMNTLDYRKVDEGVKAWADVTTGTFRDSLTKVSADDQQLLQEQKKISTGRVVDAAVVDVDLDKGTATVIAAVEVTVQDDLNPGSEPTVKRNRFSAELLRDKDDDNRWKLESLQQVAVNLS